MTIHSKPRWFPRLVEHCEGASAALVAVLIHVVLLTLLLSGQPFYRDINGSSGVAGGESALRIRWVGVTPAEAESGQVLPALHVHAEPTPATAEVPILDMQAESRISEMQDEGADEADRSNADPEMSAEVEESANAGGGEADGPAMDAYEDLLAVYLNALRSTVRMHWSRVEREVPLPDKCELTIHQGSQGQIESVEIGHCALNARQKKQLARAVHAAQTLPFAGFERVAKRSIMVQM